MLNNWKYAADGSAAPPPQSPVDCGATGACGPVIDVKLVPFGTTHLRMTQVPYTALTTGGSNTPLLRGAALE